MVGRERTIGAILQHHLPPFSSIEILTHKRSIDIQQKADFES